MASRGLDPLRLTSDFWTRDDVIQALRDRDVGALFRLIQKHTGASQTKIANAVGMTHTMVGAFISRKRHVTALDVYERIADGLDMPDAARLALGLAPRGLPTPDTAHDSVRPAPATVAEQPPTVLARLITKFNLTYPEAARDLGISERHLGRIARGERSTGSLHASTRRALEREFQRPIDELLSRYTPGATVRLTDSEHDESDVSLIDITGFAAWVEQSNTGDAAISVLAETARSLAEKHTRTAPARMLSEVTHVRRQTQTLLLSGKQRLYQTRDLLRIDADLLAHTCILLGDLYNDDAAIAHGLTAALCAHEAGVSVAAALSAQAKTERWRGRYQVSADAARQGYECSPPTPLRILLACQEANAAALLGDSERAREALRRAEHAAETVAPDSGVTPWSCPPPRQALFELSVSLQLGEAEAALRAAEKADTAWTSGEPYVHGTWAQIRFGAGNAYVMMGELDGTAQQILPVMNMQPEHRMATITNYLVAMDTRLQAKRFRGSDLAADIRGQIREFNSAATPFTPQETP